MAALERQSVPVSRRCFIDLCHPVVPPQQREPPSVADDGRTPVSDRRGGPSPIPAALAATTCAPVSPTRALPGDGLGTSARYVAACNKCSHRRSPSGHCRRPLTAGSVRSVLIKLST
jgi:hypothetical protein